MAELTENMSADQDLSPIQSPNTLQIVTMLKHESITMLNKYLDLIDYFSVN